MTDRYRVYTKVKKTLKTMMKLDHQGQVVTLAMMIAGIVLSRKAQLSEMSSEIPTATQEKSVEMRMRRWVKDELDVEAVYLPFARQILEALSHLPLVLVMDGSQAGRGCMVLMVGVLYQKRALPIAWLVYKGKKGHAVANGTFKPWRRLCRFCQRAARWFYWAMPSTIRPKCCSGWRKTRLGSMFYALRPRFTSRPGPKASRFETIRCNPGTSFLCRKSVSRRLRQSRSTPLAGGVLGTKKLSFSSPTSKMPTKPVVTIGDGFGLRPSFPTRKAGASTFTRVIWLTLPV
jgi:hypothetical protein